MSELRILSNFVILSLFCPSEYADTFWLQNQINRKYSKIINQLGSLIHAWFKRVLKRESPPMELSEI